MLKFAILIPFLQGIILAILRLDEPIYQFIFYREIYSWFGYLYSND